MLLLLSESSAYLIDGAEGVPRRARHVPGPGALVLRAKLEQATPRNHTAQGAIS